jgi:hypothetical protein
MPGIAIRFSRLVAVALGISMVAPAAGGAIVYWNEPGGNGHGYEAVLAPGPGGVTWTSARGAAHAAGGALAGISSAAENQFVFSLINQPQYWFITSGRYFGPWIGGMQAPGTAVPSANWSWDNGDTWNYTNWLAGQPDDFQGQPERYLDYFSRDTAGGRQPTWNDALDTPNGGLVLSYVVEYPALVTPPAQGVPLPGAVWMGGVGGVMVMRAGRRRWRGVAISGRRS